MGSEPLCGLVKRMHVTVEIQGNPTEIEACYCSLKDNCTYRFRSHGYDQCSWKPPEYSRPVGWGQVPKKLNGVGWGS